ncbi:MAG: DUF1854 domain-containing protein [Burkholderiales bacterium]
MSMTRGAFTLSLNDAGQLVLATAAGERHFGVQVVRAFPISGPDEGFALVDSEGRELAWVERLEHLDPAARALVEAALAGREFLPTILRLRAVTGHATPSTWTVDTDRGETRFVLAAEEDIRRLGHGRLLISDAAGVQYLVRDLEKLDRGSRRLLDRFL